VGLLLQLVQFLKPSFAAKRVAHLEFTRKMVDERIGRITHRKDFLQYVRTCQYRSTLASNADAFQILQPIDDPREMLNHDEILGNSRVLLTAGSETTATHLCGATWYLLTHPIALRRAQTEVRNAFKQAEDITLRSVSSPGSLPFLNAVIEETLRCYPSIPSTLPRTTGATGLIIDGRYVPANVRGPLHVFDNIAS